jgi:hypothetical protein
MVLGSTQLLRKMRIRNISWGGGGGVKAAGDKDDNPTTLMCRLPLNVGASNSWKPQGPSRPVMGLLYLLFIWACVCVCVCVCVHVRMC